MPTTQTSSGQQQPPPPERQEALRALIRRMAQQMVKEALYEQREAQLPQPQQGKA